MQKYQEKVKMKENKKVKNCKNETFQKNQKIMFDSQKTVSKN